MLFFSKYINKLILNFHKNNNFLTVTNDFFGFFVFSLSLDRIFFGFESDSSPVFNFFFFFGGSSIVSVCFLFPGTSDDCSKYSGIFSIISKQAESTPFSNLASEFSPASTITPSG